MIFKRLLNLIFPEGYSCINCGIEIFDQSKGFCENCLKSLTYINGKVCYHCGDPLVSDGDYCKRCKGKKFIVDRAIAPFTYKGIIKNLIFKLKYQGAKYLAKPLSNFMIEKFNTINLTYDYIIPIPLCSKRFKQRGYNQSLLLAQNIDKQKIMDNNLIRIKETQEQANLTATSRKKNMIGAFKLKDKKLVKDKIILLIDDVYTTGATTDECAKILKQANAKAVYVLTLAHTILSKKNN